MVMVATIIMHYITCIIIYYYYCRFVFPEESRVGRISHLTQPFSVSIAPSQRDTEAVVFYTWRARTVRAVSVEHVAEKTNIFLVLLCLILLLLRIYSNYAKFHIIFNFLIETSQRTQNPDFRAPRENIMFCME